MSGQLAAALSNTIIWHNWNSSWNTTSSSSPVWVHIQFMSTGVGLNFKISTLCGRNSGVRYLGASAQRRRHLDRSKTTNPNRELIEYPAEKGQRPHDKGEPPKPRKSKPPKNNRSPPKIDRNDPINQIPPIPNPPPQPARWSCKLRPWRFTPHPLPPPAPPSSPPPLPPRSPSPLRSECVSRTIDQLVNMLLCHAS